MKADITERKLAVDALKESEERYRTLFENMLEGFAYCRIFFEQGRPVDFVYLDVNPSFETLTGLKNVVGKRVSEVIPGLQASNPEIFEIYGRVASGGGAERFETFVEPLGIWFSIAVSSPKNEHFVAVFDNITKRKRSEQALRENEDKFRTLTEAVDVGIFHSLLNGTFLHTNPAMARMAGYESVEEFMRTNANALYANLSDRQEIIAELLSSGSVKERELISVRKDGSHFWISFSAVLMRNQTGDNFAVLGTVIDITKRRSAEEERIRLLKLELNARLEAEAALRDRDEFFTLSSHELKTPLSALKIQIEGMQMLLEHSEAPAAELRHGFDVAVRQVQRLVRLVNGILDIKRIRTGQLEMNCRSCDLAALAREVLYSNQAALQRAGCEASYSGPDSVQGAWDADRLEQVLENLLGNAMIFARGTRIDILCDDSPEMVRISMRDRGTGIPSFNPESIFEPYERGGGQLHRGGLGMGLYISREIIRKHGGSIRAENSEDGGSIFIIELPRSEPRVG